MVKEANDQFTLWPCCSGIGIFAFLAVVTYWPIAQIAFSVVFVLWGIPFGIFVLGALGITVWRGVTALLTSRWRRALSMLALPVTLALTFPAISRMIPLENKLTFRLHEKRYAAAAAKAEREGKRVAWVADWGGGVMIGFNRFVLWDEKDDVALPSAQRSAEWKQELPDGDRLRVQQYFGNHFYLIDE
jgi:hypothetical protein